MASKVDPRILWKTPSQQPNGLQATADGLWVIDQIDPNDIYLLNYDDGRELIKAYERAASEFDETLERGAVLGALEQHHRDPARRLSKLTDLVEERSVPS